MAVSLPSPRRPSLLRARPSPAAPPIPRSTTRSAGDDWRGVVALLPGLMTTAVALWAVGHLVDSVLDAPPPASTAPVTVEVSGVLDTAGLAGGGATSSELIVRNTGGSDLHWAWRPVVIAPAATTAALTATATLGRCSETAVARPLPASRDAPTTLAPGHETRVCVRLQLPESSASRPLDVSVRVDATPA